MVPNLFLEINPILCHLIYCHLILICTSLRIKRDLNHIEGEEYKDILFAEKEYVTTFISAPPQKKLSRAAHHEHATRRGNTSKNATSTQHAKMRKRSTQPKYPSNGHIPTKIQDQISAHSNEIKETVYRKGQTLNATTGL